MQSMPCHVVHHMTTAEWYSAQGQNRWKIDRLAAAKHASEMVSHGSLAAHASRAEPIWPKVLRRASCHFSLHRPHRPGDQKCSARDHTNQASNHAGKQKMIELRTAVLTIATGILSDHSWHSLAWQSLVGYSCRQHRCMIVTWSSPFCFVVHFTASSL